jgi:PAP2 superfamily
VYINAQTSVTVGSLAFLYLFHNRSFYFVRNMFMVAMGLALIGYMIYPTAPPRFFPEWGFEDSVSDLVGVTPRSPINALFNPYAAVPSMHVCFALMIGVPLARLCKSRVARGFWTIYPLLVTFVIVATANHFIADAVLGALTAVVAASAAASLARARPAAWAFSPARATA